MKTTITMLMMALSLTLTACSQSPPPAPAPAPDTSAADAAAIRAGVDEMVAAWNAGNNADVAAAIAADAVLMQPDGSPVNGRDAVAATITSNYDITLMQQTATTDEVILMGDYAYSHGTWKLDPTPAAGEDAQGMNGKWSVLSKRGPDGTFQIARWMWNQADTAAGG